MDLGKQFASTAIFAISSITACSPAPANSEPSPGIPVDELNPPAAPEEPTGGMDSAGGHGIGLSWENDLFFQQSWLDEQFVFTVYNRASSSAEIEIHQTSCDEGCNPVGPALETWHVPAASVTTFSGTDVDSLESDGLLSFSADGQWLGMISSIVRPVLDSGLTLISNHGLNWSGGQSVQVEAAFAAAEPPDFTLTLTVVSGGTLVLLPTTPSVRGVQFVDVVSVQLQRPPEESDAGGQNTTDGGGLSIPHTSGGFIVDATAATADSPIRVNVDVVVPAGFTGPFVGFDAFFCSVPLDGTRETCGNGGGVTRGIALTAAQ